MQIKTYINCVIGALFLVASSNVAAMNLEATGLDACDFGTIPGARPIQINLARADDYNYGEVYGQIYFYFTRKRAGGAAAERLSAASWFAGVRQTLVDYSVLREDKEYIITLSASANFFDRASNANRRTELGKQVLFQFKSGNDGIKSVGTNIQTGSRKISTADREGLFVLTPRYEIIDPINVVEIEIQYLKSKQTRVEIGIFKSITSLISSALGMTGVITFPAQQSVASVIDSATRPLQDVVEALSDKYEPIESLTKIKSIGFLPNEAVSFSNVASYSVDVREGKTDFLYEVAIFAGVLPSIVTNQRSGCKYPQYSADPNSILKAAVTPTNVSIENLYKEDNLRRIYLSQLGRQVAKEDLIDACNAIKEDVRRYFGGFDAYAISWALFAVREKQFRDKEMARDCFTSAERDIVYTRLKLPELWK